MEQLGPEQVFTPKTIVDRRMFARRNEPALDGNPGLQDSLHDALIERGGQVLLYGDTGVGKSSLLKYAAEDAGLRAVTVECKSGMRYADIVDALVKKLVTVRQVAVRRTAAGEVSAAAEGKVPWFTKLSGSIKLSGQTEADYEVVERDALDVVLDVMERAGTSLIVLDNFQNIDSAETRTLVAQLLEQLSDRAQDTDLLDIKAVVVGIADDAKTLLGESRSYSRRTTEIGVPRMPDDEIEEILTRGFELLKIDAGHELIERFVFYSDGFPYFAHLLGLNVSRMVIRSGRNALGGADLSAALRRASTAVSSGYGERFRIAKEASGDVRPRQEIMRLLAASSQRVWSGTEVQALWQSKNGNRDDWAFLHVALGQLIQPKYGKILRRTGKAKRYQYQFEDPHMRPYLRIAEGFDL